MVDLRSEIIHNRESFFSWLEVWLEEQSQFEWHEEFASLASRLVLRVLPLVLRSKLLNSNEYSELLKFSFLLSLVVRCTRSDFDPTLARAVESANIFLNARFAYYDDDHAVQTAVIAAEGSKSGFSASVIKDLFDSVLAHAEAALNQFGLEAHELWRSVRRDVDLIENGQSRLALQEEPLWQNYPIWWFEALRIFQDGLLGQRYSHDSWSIWLDWYIPIVGGKPAFNLANRIRAEELERAIALGNKASHGSATEFYVDFWVREPAEINRDIAEWVAEARAAEVVGDVVAVPAEPDFPAQSLDATMFGLNAAGRIERIAIPPEQQLFITPLQQRQYKTLRSDAEGLLGRGQILGKLGSEISDLIKVLPDDMTHAAVFDVWRAINRLRRTLNAHVRVVDIDEPHEAKLELSIAEELGFLLDTANNFAFDDPGLRRRDEQSIPPQDKQSIAGEWALGDVIAKAALKEPEIFTPAALEVVKAEERNAETAGEDAHGQQAIDQTNKTRRNVIAALLSVLKGESGFAWKEMRSGVYKKAGELGAIAVATDVLGWTTIYPAIWNFVVRHSSNLSAYVKTVYNNPTLTAYIEYISKAAG